MPRLPTRHGVRQALSSYGFSAYDVIKAIRERAGVGVDNGDPYLESAKGSKDAMREIIRNERRLELCFENKRFGIFAAGRPISTRRPRAYPSMA